MRFKSISLYFLIIFLSVTPVVMAEKAKEQRMDLNDVLKAGNLKSWHGWLMKNKPIIEEQNYSNLLTSKPVHLVVVPMEPDIALTIQNMLADRPKQKSDLVASENILLITYTIKYGEPLWWSPFGAFYFGRPNNPPDEFGLEMTLKAYLLNTSTKSLVSYPALSFTGNTSNRDTKLNELFDKIKSEAGKGRILKKARDLVIRVGRAIDGKEKGVDENIRRKIAMLEIKAFDAKLRQRGAEVLVDIIKIDEIENLLNLLDDEDRDVRSAVMKELNEKLQSSGINEEVRSLLVAVFKKALLDNSSYVREQATVGLGKIRLAEGLEPLRVAAKDEVISVRKAAAKSLGQIGNKKAVESLILLLDDKNSGVGKAASISLDRLGWEPPDMTMRLKYFFASDDKTDDLIALGEPAVTFLIEMLQSRDTGRIKKAAEVLGKMEDQRAVNPLLIVLASTDAKLQIAAAEALGKIGNPIAVIPLIASLKERNDSIRIAAINALAEIKDTRAAEPISQLLEAKNKEVRKVAYRALKRLNWQTDNINKKISAMFVAGDVDGIVKIGNSAVRPLIIMLADESEETRVKVIQILGLLGTDASSAIIPITASLQSKNEKEVIAAASALANIGEDTASRAIQNALESHKKTDKASLWLRYALAQLGGQREEHLRFFIDVLSSELGDTAVELISRLDLSSEEIQIFYNYLKDPDTIIRKRTTLILANVGGTTVVDKLWERLTEEDNEEIRKAIRQAIKKASKKDGK